MIYTSRWTKWMMYVMKSYDRSFLSNFIDNWNGKCENSFKSVLFSIVETITYDGQQTWYYYIIRKLNENAHG